MKPDPTVVLTRTAMKLSRELAGAMAPGYDQSSLVSMGTLLVLVAQEVDRAAHVTWSENQAMRAVFRAAADVVGLPLAAEAYDAGASSDADLRLSTLEKGNAALRTLLIRVQERLEEMEGAAARELELRILRMLAEWAAARVMTLPGR